MVSSYRSIDFISENLNNEFRVSGSSSRNRLIIESIPNTHTDLSLLKNHEIFVVDYGNTMVRKIGFGRNPRLHVKDEWITYYDFDKKIIQIQNLLTQKKFEIKLSKKQNPFFIPDVEMISTLTIVFSDINESGHAALISFDLITLKSSVIYKSSLSGTKIEVCRGDGFLGVGEFPYEGVSRSSKIQIAKITDYPELTGFNTIHESNNEDIGNLICQKDSIYFIKAISSEPRINHKITEAAKIHIKDQRLEISSNLKHVSQLIQMDGRVMIPFRGELYVLEGNFDLSEDKLKPIPSKEELQIDI